MYTDIFIMECNFTNHLFYISELIIVFLNHAPKDDEEDGPRVTKIDEF